MRRIAAFLCAFTLASATIASAAPMPWTLFNEPYLLKSVTSVQPFQCPRDGEVLIVWLVSENHDRFMFGYEPESGRVIFVFAPKGGTTPTEIGFGHVDPAKHNEIPPLFWVAFQPEIHNDLCKLLFDTGV